MLKRLHVGSEPLREDYVAEINGDWSWQKLGMVLPENIVTKIVGMLSLLKDASEDTLAQSGLKMVISLSRRHAGLL